MENQRLASAGKRSATTFFPPCTVLIHGLGVDPFDLEQDTVVVKSSYLRFLLGKLASLADFDPQWYEQANPDVQAAKQAGTVASYREHFESQGFLEGRSASEPVLDADFYGAAYADLAGCFETPVAALIHFNNSGRNEGRAGLAEHFNDAENWRLGRLK